MSPQPLAKTLQAGERAGRYVLVDAAVLGHAGGEAPISRRRSMMTSWPCEYRATNHVETVAP